jgi:hypothetical protein
VPRGRSPPKQPVLSLARDLRCERGVLAGIDQPSCGGGITTNARAARSWNCSMLLREAVAGLFLALPGSSPCRNPGAPPRPKTPHNQLDPQSAGSHVTWSAGSWLSIAADRPFPTPHSSPASVAIPEGTAFSRSTMLQQQRLPGSRVGTRAGSFNSVTATGCGWRPMQLAKGTRPACHGLSLPLALASSRGHALPSPAHIQRPCRRGTCFVRAAASPEPPPKETPGFLPSLYK